MTSMRSGRTRAIPRMLRSAQTGMTRVLGIEILRGEHPAGETLPPEAELMARFKVSRTVVREVLKTLAAKGLVVSKTKVGTRVLEPVHWNMFDADVLSWRLEQGIDPAFLASLFEIRRAIEPAAAALAAGRRSEDDLAYLRELVARMSTSRSDIAFAEADVAFHLAVNAASGNPFMRSVGAVIKAALLSSFTLSSPADDAERLAIVAKAHGRIVDAIAARDGEGAREAMFAVIAEGQRHRISAIE